MALSRAMGQLIRQSDWKVLQIYAMPLVLCGKILSMDLEQVAFHKSNPLRLSYSSSILDPHFEV